MNSESPFLLFKIECPVCRTLNEFELVRVGAFVEEGRDSDFAPRNVKWRFPRYQPYHPLVFFTATCGNCYYTREMTNEYKDWKNDANYRTYKLKSVKEKHLDRLAGDGSIIKMLGAHIDVGRYPNESGILKLHLAIFDELLYEYPSHLDVGRFYLRIGWIYREMDKGDNPNVLLMRGLVQELTSKFTTLRNSAERFNSDIVTFAKQIENHFHVAHLPADVKAQMLAFQGTFQAEGLSLQKSAQQNDAALEKIRQLVDEYRLALLGKGDTGSGSAFGNFSTLGEFLSQAKVAWSGIVIDERSALEQAIYHYKRAFAEGKDIHAGNQQIQASYLIAELSRRIGNHDEARQFFTSTIKTGQELIHQHRNDQSRTALAKKILELAIEQGRVNLAAAKSG